MKVNKKKCIKLVVEQITAMINNNKDYSEWIGESFVDWCEGGVVFYHLRDIENDGKGINEKEEKQCIKYMKELAPLIDNVTDKLLYIYNGIDEENEKATI